MNKTIKNFGAFIYCFVVLFVVFSSCGQVSDEVVSEVDSLNRRAYNVRYASHEESRRLSDEVLARFGESGYNDGVYEALINKGFVYYMQMRYDSVRVCCEKVLNESHNELLCAMADISLMSVCNMSGMSKEFYDYRSDAQERLAKVAEEEGVMTEHQLALWHSVQTQFHIASLRYFIRMRLSDGVSESADWLDANGDKFSDDQTLMVSYLMQKSMLSLRNGDGEDALTIQRRNLIMLLDLSIQNDFTYMKAEAMNRLARTIFRNGELNEPQTAYAKKLMQVGDSVELGLLFAEQALKDFETYGNGYTISRALVSLSDYRLRDGKGEEALAMLQRALGMINKHHLMLNNEHAHVQKRLGSSGGTTNDVCASVLNADTLCAYSVCQDTMSTEMAWILDPSVVTVPDWMAGVREQLSVVYGALGMKLESDYNHNIYFDILDATRQDQRVLQQELNLNNEERMLNVLILVFVLVIVFIVWGLFVFNRKSTLLYQQRVRKLSEVIDVCKNMTAVLSENAEDEETLLNLLHRHTDNDVRRLFPDIADDEDWTATDLKLLSGMDRELLNVLFVFFKWMKEQGMTYISFADEERRLESETYLLEKRFEESKKQYLEKLTSMSIVNGITPFLDRALHEVAKLKSGDDDRVKERFEYVSELIDKINEYNDVLGHWVKIRRGLVSLSVENFSLQPLFDMLKLGSKTFENKGVKLVVNDSATVVKADKSLTLFMMNTLLDNARKFTPQGGSVELSALVLDDCVEIAVKDTGHGMSAEDVEMLNGQKVYDSGRIGTEGEHASEVKQQKGFGFGLMNCKGVIEQYRKTNAVFSVCKFGVESEPGKGSRFFFRLPKGVLKVMSMLLLCLLTLTSCGEREKLATAEVLTASVNMHEIVEDSLLDEAEYYSDCVFTANVEGNYELALLYADSAIAELNAYYLKKTPGGTKLMNLDGGEMAEVDLWREGFKTDYELIISIRNEVAISALALNRNHLYHYNCEVFSRLYKLASTDDTLEEYCNNIRETNKNKKAIAVMLGLVLFVVVFVYFFLHYRRYQLFIFNLRQLIELNNKVFTADSADLKTVLLQSLSDIKQVERIELMQDEPTLADKVEMQTWQGNLRAYPLTVKTADEEVSAGVMTVLFRDNKLTADEELIMDLVRQFISIHTYFSIMKVSERNTMLELKEDERRRVEIEEQKVHVQNLIMDNCMSALKHETMYYPNRIKQIVDSALDGCCVIDKETKVIDTLGEVNTNGGDVSGKSDDVREKVADVDELLTYYKEVFSILSTCAGKQVERMLFKRSIMPVAVIGEMVSKSFKKQSKKATGIGRLKINASHGLKVMGDRVFLQMLIDNVLSLYFEHHSGGNMNVDFEDADGFVKFSFTDELYTYDEAEIPNLFYVDSVKYNAKEDRLVGMQYLLTKQIIREHDQYSSRRGCRIYVENDEVSGSRFVFTLEKS